MRVAITGVGIVSCLGLDRAAVVTSLREGRSGVVSDPEREQVGFRSPLTGAIVGFNPRDYVNRKQIKSMGEPAQYAVGAAQDAIRHARLDLDLLRDPGAGIIVGNDSCALPAVETADIVRESRQTRSVGSGKILQVMNSTVTMNLATLFGVQGAAWTVSGACASGAHAVGQAHMLVSSGQQDVVLAGGAQEINWVSMASFDALGAFATTDGDPASACRPFDAKRSGLVPSGGAAMLVLERMDRAVERGATVLAEVCSYAFSADGQHLTQPGGDGAIRAMRQALERAKVSPSEVEYINAHATGTPVGDVVEGKAILDVFGSDTTPPVSSTKSMTGHECWMAGASELVYSILMMQEGFLAPNINLETLDGDLEGLNVLTETLETRPRIVLSNSFGFGGTNATILMKAFED